MYSNKKFFEYSEYCEIGIRQAGKRRKMNIVFKVMDFIWQYTI